MLLDGLAAFDGALGLAAQHAQDAVGVAHAGHLGVGHQQRLVGKVHGHERAAFNAGGRVADDVFKAHAGQVGQDLLDAFLRQRVLVARLAGGQHEQVVALFVLDERLVQVGLALDHVDEVIHHAAFAAHDEVEVAQADVKVDHGSLVAAQGEAGGKAGTGGGLAHATLAGGHDDDFGHVC
jgi:hypothetical protein